MSDYRQDGHCADQPWSTIERVRDQTRNGPLQHVEEEHHHADLGTVRPERVGGPGRPTTDGPEVGSVEQLAENDADGNGTGQVREDQDHDAERCLQTIRPLPVPGTSYAPGCQRIRTDRESGFPGSACTRNERFGGRCKRTRTWAAIHPPASHSRTLATCRACSPVRVRPQPLAAASSALTSRRAFAAPFRPVGPSRARSERADRTGPK